MAKSKISWLRNSESHDYAAAEEYLTLLMPPSTAKVLVRRLRRSTLRQFKAKDVFRASTLPLLGTDSWHVQKDRAKIQKRKKLSPLLLVRGKPPAHLTIADGYHRLCAVYSFDEDAVIPCKIV